MNWYLKVLRQATDFNGRARRQEYWIFFLFNILFSIAAAILDNILGLAFPQTGYGPVYVIYALTMLVPGIAVFIRRMHDLGKSGWWFFIAFVPLIGGIWLLILVCTEGNKGPNEYGEDPKEEGEPA